MRFCHIKWFRSEISHFFCFPEAIKGHIAKFTLLTILLMFYSCVTVVTDVWKPVFEEITVVSSNFLPKYFSYTRRPYLFRGSATLHADAIWPQKSRGRQAEWFTARSPRVRGNQGHFGHHECEFYIYPTRATLEMITIAEKSAINHSFGLPIA